MRKIFKPFIFSIAIMLICSLPVFSVSATPKKEYNTTVSSQKSSTKKSTSQKVKETTTSTKKASSENKTKVNSTKESTTQQNKSTKSATSSKETTKTNKKPTTETTPSKDTPKLKEPEVNNVEEAPSEIPQQTSPDDWKIVDDGSSSEGFSAIQKNIPLVGSINDGNFLFVTGIVFLCLSVLGISFFIYLLTRKKHSGSHFKK